MFASNLGDTESAFPTPTTAITSAQARQRPVIMITRSPDGRSQVCVPDAGELRVIDDRRVRVAVWPSSPTAADLDRDASALLIVTNPSDVHLIHVTARRLANAAMVWAHYELTVTSSRTAARGTAPDLQPAPGEAEVITESRPRKRRDLATRR
ncbi:hypothetical protein [Spirillospora sp. NPDC047279]|uniref:hypothetical protein n=1 Tax=Spirillospora sp. NPDC047279 TaxID=3155478 RepID=UPI0033EB3F89